MTAAGGLEVFRHALAGSTQDIQVQDTCPTHYPFYDHAKRIPTNAMVQAAAATSPVLSIINQIPNTSSTFIPISMPCPGGKGAPSFNGKHVQDFISDFESAAKAAGIANTEWPKLVLRYCDSKVHRIIENDAAFTGIVWADARTQLTYYYESSDHEPKVSPRRLCVYDEKAKKEYIRDLRDFDNYVSNMVTKGRLSDTDRNLSFYKGVPKRLCKKLKASIKTTASHKLTSHCSDVSYG
ncbi:hypothetical protein BKA93DRAFT_746851 [Sparassis latifolia]